MTTRTITPVSSIAAPQIFDGIARLAAAIRAGWRAARDWDRLSAAGDGMSREQVARAVFERNFA